MPKNSEKNNFWLEIHSLHTHLNTVDFAVGSLEDGAPCVTTSFLSISHIPSSLLSTCPKKASSIKSQPTSSQPEIEAHAG